MMSIHLVAAGTFLFIAESAVRLGIYRGGESAGHAIAWGVIRGISLCAEERVHRIWAIWFPHLSMLVWVPLAVGLGELTLAEIAVETGPARLLYLYGYLQLLQALGAAVAVPLYLVRMTRRIRAGQLGFSSQQD